MLSEHEREVIARGLREAFDADTFEAISELTGGHTSSRVFRLVVRGTPYVAKIITRADDPTRHFANLRSAADAGLAPRVWYTSVPDKICITDFIASTPLSMADGRIRFPALLRALHDLPRFEPAPFNTTCTFLLQPGPMRDGFLERCKAADILSPSEVAECFARYAELAAACPYGDEDMVSSHNDVLKPDNILFDGRRLWLIDWEASCLNDRYADLAVAANLVVGTADEEHYYLQQYFGADPSAYQSARFHLTQQLSHLFYTLAFLFMSSPAGRSMAAQFRSSPEGGAPDTVPGYAEFQRIVWARQVDLADPGVKRLYGRVHWTRLSYNVRQPRYTEALRIVSGGRG